VQSLSDPGVVFLKLTAGLEVVPSPLLLGGQLPGVLSIAAAADSAGASAARAAFMLAAYIRSAVVENRDGRPVPLPLQLETGDRFMRVTGRLQIIDEHARCFIIAGSGYRTCSTS
jgi:hypothetical protein